VLTARYICSIVNGASGEALLSPVGEVDLSAMGQSHSQNSCERPTKFSHMRLWLSWMPREMASARGVP
jgi:hypothetical protein